MLFEAIVSDVFFQPLSSTSTIGQITQDDGDDACGVVNDLGIVFKVAVLTSMKTVVITRLKELGTHAHELLSWGAEDVVTFEYLLLYERK